MLFRRVFCIFYGRFKEGCIFAEHVFQLVNVDQLDALIVVFERMGEALVLLPDCERNEGLLHLRRELH